MKHLFYQLIATFSFFTRLPFWRLANVPKEYYERVVPYWPVVGWLTGLLTAFVCCATAFLPAHISVILGLIVRCFVTGALHEDGFADFCDGFGGGYNRERILSIMKDSHIGTYGVLGLILYFALQISTTSYIVGEIGPCWQLILVIVSADTISKFLSSTIIYFLPYARTEETSKNKLVYKSARPLEVIFGGALAFLPLLLLATTGNSLLAQQLGAATMAAMLCTAILFRLMKARIEGYTGDCCGASFIIAEAVFFVSLTVALAI